MPLRGFGLCEEGVLNFLLCFTFLVCRLCYLLRPTTPLRKIPMSSPAVTYINTHSNTYNAYRPGYEDRGKITFPDQLTTS